jgi:hypothetical protein
VTGKKLQDSLPAQQASWGHGVAVGAGIGQKQTIAPCCGPCCTDASHCLPTGSHPTAVQEDTVQRRCAAAAGLLTQLLP